MNNLCKESLETVEELYTLYADDEYMQKYMHSYFTVNLKQILENMKTLHVNRQTHIQEMGIEQENFIQTFLNQHKYYYVPHTDKYFVYDELRYSAITEDNIIHHILTEISKDKRLVTWKQRTKVSLMKRIKENQLSRTIPNSETIQHVLDLFCPLLFSTKTEAKYFLTILGDNMLKKNGELIHFIQPKSKLFLRELNNYAQILMGTNAIQTFKYKYHEHSYTNCRLIQINDSVKNEHLWAHLMQSSLDILSVCFHYSSRYGNADDFIQNKNNDKEIETSILFLRNKTPETIVDMFIDTFMTPAAYSVEISWKAMQYLWKQFLDANKLPAIIFQTNLKQILTKNKLQYNEENDCFHGVNSKYLPSIQCFLKFWRENMIYDATESDMELDEIAMLFTKYICKVNSNSAHSMTEKQIIDLITCFFPNVEIENDKYIHKYKCVLWDKQMDIMSALSIIMSSEEYSSPGANTAVSVYDCYDKYCQINCQQKKPCVNKQYFEKYMSVYNINYNAF